MRLSWNDDVRLLQTGRRRRGGLLVTTLASGGAGLVRGGHGGVEGGELAHHLLVLVLLVSVDGLRVLAQVVEARELLAAVTRERAFAGVFPEANSVNIADIEQ